MPSYRCNFRDGPCAGQSRLIEMPLRPLETLQCGGKTYELFPSSNPTVLVYVVRGGLIDQAASTVHGQRDVFQAWHRFLHALHHRTARKRRALWRASNRIRRAVR